jgi:long-chain acyl-CoA synthetase
VAEEIRTLADLPFHVSGRYPKSVLIRRCQAAAADVTELSARAFFEQVRDLSLGLGALGVEDGDRVALLSESRPEWLIADFAVLTRGAVTVPIYPTLPEAQVRYILADSGARVVVASDEAQAAKVRAVWPDLPDLSVLIVVDGAPSTAPAVAAVREELSLADATARGHRRLMDEDGLGRMYKEAAAAIAPDRLATIIYTSGTTGEPKGVMLSHENVVSNVIASDAVISVTDDDEALSFLPLSHAFERMVCCLYLYKGVTISFAESLDTIARDLQGVRPTTLTGVPRVYEKLHARIHDAVAQAPAVRRALFHWALGVGGAASRAARAGRPVPLVTRLQLGVASRLVLSKVRERLGGRVRFLVSGSAPLSVPVAEFLFAIGVPVVEGYGLTETAPVLTVNPLEAPRPGSVGVAVPGVEIRIAADGEILARGPNVMQGYYNKPDATAAVIVDGWFHTGDIGQLDDGGYLTITDRKKEIIVTAGGKNVAPTPIEAELKRSPIVAEAVLIGNRRPCITALLVPDFDALAHELDTPAGAEALDTPAGAEAREEVVARPEVKRRFEAVVETVNAGLPRHEQIKEFAALPAEFSIATGELTPTLKVKRRVVEERWRGTIDALYGA